MSKSEQPHPLFNERGFLTDFGMKECQPLKDEVQRLLASGRTQSEIALLGTLLMNVVGNEISLVKK